MAQQPLETAALDPAARLVNEGIELARARRHDEAVARFREALGLRPDYAKAHHNLGVALAETGLLGEAVASLRTAVKFQPDYVDAYYNLGNMLGQLKRLDEAIAAYRNAVRLKPDHPGTLNNLGLLLTQAGQPEEGLVLLKQACRVRPQFLEAINNLGMALTEVGEYQAAAACFEEALQIKPRHADSHTNLGNTYKDQGRLAEALACYDLALAIRPSAPSPRWNRALVRLHLGDYQRGWPEYEARRQKPDNGIRSFPQPDWHGTSLDGRTLLIHMEQGLGDMIQFIRYAALIPLNGGRVVVSCPATLESLFARCRGIHQVVCDRGPLPDFDVQVPLLSLPCLLKTTLDTIPADVPYLTADEVRVEYWRQQLAKLPGLKVGLVWQGNPRHRKDRQRSIPLVCFEPLARVPGVHLISLQKGPGVEQLHARRRGPMRVHEWGAEYSAPTGTFMDTAALIMNLDIVVSVDTAVAHLAGALGVPVWVALPQTADWRWLLQRSDSPWYPSMRLYRQQELGRWEPVMAALANDLEQYVSDHGRGGRIPFAITAFGLVDRIARWEARLARPADSAAARQHQAKLASLRSLCERFLPRCEQYEPLIQQLATVYAALAQAHEDFDALGCDKGAGTRRLELADAIQQHRQQRDRLRAEFRKSIRPTDGYTI